MRILKIKLVNFGKHAKFEADFDASVVGLTGVNGSGKSTILTAIEYLFTGDVPDTISSYIKLGEKKAVLSLEFMKKGMRGVIKREILPSGTKRELTWDGEKFKRASEVQGMLDDILNVDKAALHNALFIAQGALAKLLSGAQGERETLYSKMLLIDHLKKRGDRLEAFIRKTASDVVDLEPLIETAELGKENALDVCDRLRLELSALPSFQVESDNWDALLTWERKLQEKQDELQNSTTTVLNTRSAVSSVQETIKAQLGTSDIVSLQATKDAELKTANTEVTRIEQVLQSVNTVALHKARLVDVEAALQRHKESRSTYAAILGTIGMPNVLQEAYDKAMATMESIKTWRQHREDLTTLNNELETLVPPTAPELHIEDLEASVIELHLKLEAAQSVEESGKTTCWVCGGELPAELLDIEQLQKTLEPIQIKLNEERLLQSNYLSASSTHTATVAHLRERKERVEAEIATMPVLEGPAADPEDLAEKLKTSKDASAFVNAADAEISTQEQIKATTLEAIAQLNVPDVDTDKAQQELLGMRAVRDSLYGELETIASLSRNLETCVQAHAMAEERAANLGQEALTMSSTVVLAQNALPQTLQILLKTTPKEDVKSVLTERTNAHNSKKGELQQAERTLEEARKELRRLLERAENDKKRVDAINQLTRVRDMLAKDGLILKYTQYVFNSMEGLIQTRLEKMEADFTVKVDPEIPVHFLFTRLDEDSGWLPQKKLSGGQAVRLALALLLAVQKRIMPDLGFLVLDEPSMHLDDEGVDSLRAILMGLQAELSNAEAQLIVCDHKKDLETAYAKTIHLV